MTTGMSPSFNISRCFSQLYSSILTLSMRNPQVCEAGFEMERRYRRAEAMVRNRRLLVECYVLESDDSTLRSARAPSAISLLSALLPRISRTRSLLRNSFQRFSVVELPKASSKHSSFDLISARIRGREQLGLYMISYTPSMIGRSVPPSFLL